MNIHKGDIVRRTGGRFRTINRGDVARVTRAGPNSLELDGHGATTFDPGSFIVITAGFDGTERGATEVEL